MCPRQETVIRDPYLQHKYRMLFQIGIYFILSLFFYIVTI